MSINYGDAASDPGTAIHLTSNIFPEDQLRSIYRKLEKELGEHRITVDSLAKLIENSKTNKKEETKKSQLSF